MTPAPPPGFELVPTDLTAPAAPAMPAPPPGFELEDATPPPGPLPGSEDGAPVSQRGSMLDTFVGQGLLFGAGDEMRAGVRGAVRAALDPGLGLGEAYNQELGSSRANLEGYRERHPILAPVTEAGGAVAGAVATGGAGLGARAATTAGRVGYGALEGAGLGTAYGFAAGEDGLGNRLESAGEGFLAGGITGGVAPAAIDAVVAGGRAAAPLARALRPFRGAVDPEAEASRRIAAALGRDVGDPAAIQARMDELGDLASGGMPAVVGDMGGETTRALARSAANQSPEAREALQDVTDTRFAGQAGRATEFLGRLVGGVADPAARREQLQQAARRANRPAYTQAYREAPVLWTPELQQLAGAPAVQDAIRKATRTGANRAAADGFQPPRQPFMFDPDGRMALRSNPDGSTAIPSLQFWDHTKRALDDTVSSLQRSGAKSEAADVAALRDQLLGVLDQAAPSYATARAGAARFFGAQDALEAGQQFVASKVENREARRALARMSGPEQALFREGFVSHLVDRLREAGDRNNLLNSIFVKSPAARERVEIALGRGRAAEFESFMRVEDMMDQLRKAVAGNSTTTRQLVELGLIGSAGGVSGAYGLASGDYKGFLATALVGATRYGRSRVNARVARHVGEMLASDDPDVLRRGIEAVSRNSRLRELLRDSHSLVTRGALPSMAGPGEQ